MYINAISEATYIPVVLDLFYVIIYIRENCQLKYYNIILLHVENRTLFVFADDMDRCGYHK